MKWDNFLKRSAALAIDLTVFYIPARVAGFNHGELVPLWLLYETVLISRGEGVTLGKKIMKLKVTALNKKSVTLLMALVRAVGKLGSTAVFLLGDLWMLKDKRSQTWHDKWAGTIVTQNA